MPSGRRDLHAGRRLAARMRRRLRRRTPRAVLRTGTVWSQDWPVRGASARVPLPARLDATALRAEFPVLERARVPERRHRRAAPAPPPSTRRATELDARARRGPHARALRAPLRAARPSCAPATPRVLGAPPRTSRSPRRTSDGIGRVLAGLDLGPGDEILTSDQEHPGLLGPLIAARAARRRRSARCRCASWPTRSGRATTLVACSHVSWVTGESAPAELAAGRRAGASSTAPRAPARCRSTSQALGCAAYAASGQKWLCGADGTGMLYIAPGVPRARARDRARLPVLRRRRRAGSTRRCATRRARYDTPISREAAAFSLAALRRARGARAGTRCTSARAALAAELAERLRDAGRRVAPRGRDDARELRGPRPAGDARERLAEAGVASATCRARRSCAPRSARGTTSRTSSGCSPRWPED